MNKLLWWNSAIIYQIYPRSFKDSTGNGIGDLRGIIAKLDYIQNLCVDAIWISPFFKSPMKDFGYDIADYREVDPLFGTLDDFDELIREAHKRNIRIVIDQVLSHTSDQHLWFKESRKSSDNDKSDWYVWADAKITSQGNISPPNNWLSIFGGSAWEWDSTRQQYYLHNFLSNQPDLNYHSSALRKQILKEVEFWIKRGVDGFRLDAINFCFHDKELRDNPEKPIAERRGRGFSPDNPYAGQYHIYDNNRPENLTFLEDLRALLDQYPGVMSMGEINTEDSLKSIAEYTAHNRRLHMGYSFELLVDELSSHHIRSTVEKQIAQLEGAAPCWAISNHDVVRVLSRWGGENPNPEMAKMLSALLCCLPGTICTYQGEELGLTEAEIPYQGLQDPFGIQFWPNFKGRDGCRTPLPWHSEEKNADFSIGKTWLPIPNEHLSQAINLQENDPNSTLIAFQNLLKWRKTQKALLQGNISFIDMPDQILAFVRDYKNENIFAAFNLSDQPCVISLPPGYSSCSISSQMTNVTAGPKNEITLPPYGYLISSPFPCPSSIGQ